MSMPVLSNASRPALWGNRRSGGSLFQPKLGAIRFLIWLYLVLWLIEGGLRRWILPGLSTPLLLIRDPVVVVIYLLAATQNMFPFNGFSLASLALAEFTFLNAMELGHGNPLVALYGVRCDFLHVPLIFIMARVLRQKDLLAAAKVAVWLTIPYSILLVLQFYSPQDAWVNRGVGGSLEGAGFSGALDKFRPPGTFSFTTGPTELYPLFTACWFTMILARKLPTWLMIASGVAILVAIPVSISRTFFLGVAIVAVVGTGALFLGGRLSGGMLIQVALALLLLPLITSQLPVFKDAMEAFGARWESATVEGGGFQETIVNRVLFGLFGAFSEVRGSGMGTGFSTNVGQKLLTDEVGFGTAEAEWGRLLFDNGFILGSLVIGFRIALVSMITLAALRAWKRRSPQGIIYLSAAFPLLLNGQWGQTAALGSAIIGGGLALAASIIEPPDRQMARKSSKSWGKC